MWRVTITYADGDQFREETDDTAFLLQWIEAELSGEGSCFVKIIILNLED